MLLGWGDDGGEPLQETELAEDNMGGAVGSGTPELEGDSAIPCGAQLLVGERWPNAVTNDAPAALFVGGGRADRGVRAEAAHFTGTSWGRRLLNGIDVPLVHEGKDGEDTRGLLHRAATAPIVGSGRPAARPG